jgi:nucleoside-diphosphate kinase
MIKPGYEAVWGKVLDRIIEDGIQIVQMKTYLFTEAFAEQFYEEHVGKGFFPTLENYITSGPVLALDLAGANVIRKWRDLIGPTQKEVAVEKAPESLRALYARSTTENLCHGSDSVDSAIRELTLVFGSAPESLIPKLEPAGFDDATLAEMSQLEDLALQNATQKHARSILKQEYLEGTVLPLVLEGLSWIIRERPNDPVEHLAMYLLKNNPTNPPDDTSTVSEDSRVSTPQTPPAKTK